MWANGAGLGGIDSGRVGTGGCEHRPAANQDQGELRSLRLLACLITSSGAWLLAASPAVAGVQTASGGAVSATLAFTEVPDSELFVRDLRVSITRSGTPAYDQPARVRGCDDVCALGGGPDQPSVQVVDLEGDGEPEVLIDLFTGGAHCCAQTEALSWNGAAYVHRERDWGDPGYRLEDLDGDGRVEFVTGDPRFSALFAAYAASGFPIKVLSFEHGRFRGVTGQHKTAIRADAARWLRRYRRSRFQPQGVIAAWAADMYRLDRRAAALRFVRREVRSGTLRRIPGHADFPRTLDRTLRRFGY